MMIKKNSKIAIIGGSGLDDPKILSDFKEVGMETPYGKPSSVLTTGFLNGQEVVFLSRHGKDHSLMPTKVPFQANIWALKEIGCTHILAATACGSLKEEIKPNDLVFVDQFIDFTKQRLLTFFEDKVVHTSMADPFCPNLRKILAETAKEIELNYHEKGTMITIEGPRFSTRAESHLFRLMGADVINMSTVPEVILANELGIPYASVAMATDYDSWKEGEEPVTFEMVLKRMEVNAENVKKLFLATVPKIV